jgi:hypothetical protein
MLSRYDMDRDAVGSAGTGNTSSFLLRSDNRTWTVSMRYKAFALFMYNFTDSESNATSIFRYLGPIYTTNSNSKSCTDRYGVQLNIIPFKFITNINYRRTAQNTLTRSSTFLDPNVYVPTSSPKELQTTVGFIYYLSQTRKLNLELEDYDKEFRSDAVRDLTHAHDQSYDEQVIRLGYTIDY